jgi:restriction system protein
MNQEFNEQILQSTFQGILNGVWFALESFWYLWLLIVAFVIIKTTILIVRFTKIRKAGLPEIDKFSGTDFEIYLENLYRRLGYKVERVGKMADYGADLIIEKDGIRTAVQAKRWNNPVNVKAIQEINTAKAHYNATKALAITNNRFTSNAILLARENKVELIDRQKLASLILKRK